MSGFDVKFTSEPPHCHKTQCPICLLVQREPVQVSCCGKIFCKTCIQKIKQDSKPCPTCKETRYATFRDKSHQQSLYAFRVACSNRNDGCSWKGELGALEKHLKECRYQPAEHPSSSETSNEGDRAREEHSNHTEEGVPGSNNSPQVHPITQASTNTTGGTIQFPPININSIPPGHSPVVLLIPVLSDSDFLSESEDETSEEETEDDETTSRDDSDEEWLPQGDEVEEY